MAKQQAPVHSLQIQCAKTVSSNLIQNFADLLTAEARKNGGTISTELIEITAKNFSVDSAVECLPEALCEKVREDVYWDSRRRHPFDRLIMHRFFHLLSDYTVDHGEEPQTTLSRQLIPGFMVALTRTVGLELYEQSQYKTQRLLTKYLEATDGKPDWDDIYTDKEAIKLIDSVLLVFAQCFKNFEIRVSWVVEVVNSNLPPANAAYPQNLWKLRPSGCCLLLETLFAELRERTQSTPRSIREDYGDEADARLAAFFVGLDHATKEHQEAAALAV